MERVPYLVSVFLPKEVTLSSHVASYEETFCLGLRISFSEKVVLRRYRFYSYMLCVWQFFRGIAIFRF